MRRWLLLAALLGVAAPSPAEAKKKPPKTQGTVKKEREKSPSPSDKGKNEGAQGRRNATEDAAKAADSPQWERRP